MAAHAQIQTGVVANSGGKGAVSSFSFNHTGEAQPSRIVVVWVAARDASAAGDTAITSITYGGQAMTQIFTEVNGGGGAIAIRAEAWYIVNPASGVNSVAVTFAASVNAAIAGAVTFWNVDSTTQLDVATQHTNNNGANPSLTITPVTDRAMLVSVLGFAGSAGAAPANGQTEIYDQADDTLVELQATTLEVTTPALTTNGQTMASTRHGYGVFALRPRRRKIRTSG